MRYHQDTNTAKYGNTKGFEVTTENTHVKGQRSNTVVTIKELNLPTLTCQNGLLSDDYTSAACIHSPIELYFFLQNVFPQYKPLFIPSATDNASIS